MTITKKKKKNLITDCNMRRKIEIFKTALLQL